MSSSSTECSWDSTSSAFIKGRPVLYINVVVEDVSEAIKEGVSAKIQKLKLPMTSTSLKEKVAKHVGRIAAEKKLVSKEQIANKLASKLVQEAPLKMKKKGVTVHVEEVFRDGPYFVLAMQVQHVDATAMVAAKELAAKKKSGDAVQDTFSSFSLQCASWLMTNMGVSLADSFQTSYLPALIQSQIRAQLGGKMKRKMVEKKMQASVEVVREEKQGRLFYSLLDRVRQLEEEAASKKKTAAAVLVKSLRSKVMRSRTSSTSISSSCCSRGSSRCSRGLHSIKS